MRHSETSHFLNLCPGHARGSASHDWHGAFMSNKTTYRVEYGWIAQPIAWQTASARGEFWKTLGNSCCCLILQAPAGSKRNGFDRDHAKLWRRTGRNRICWKTRQPMWPLWLACPQQTKNHRSDFFQPCPFVLPRLSITISLILF